MKSMKLKRKIWKLTKWIREKLCETCGGEGVVRIDFGRDGGGLGRGEIMICEVCKKKQRGI